MTIVTKCRFEARRIREAFTNGREIGRRRRPLRRPAANDLRKRGKIIARKTARGSRKLVGEEMADAPQLLQRGLQRGRMRNCDRDQLAHFFRCHGCRAVDRRGAPVVPDENRLLFSEGFDEREHVAREGLTVGVARRSFGRAISAREGTDRAISLGRDQRADVIPGVGRVGESVNEQDERPFSLGDVCKAKPVGLDELNCAGWIGHAAKITGIRCGLATARGSTGPPP